MEVLNFEVSKKEIRCDKKQIIGGNDYLANFTLDEEWEGKEAICRVVWTNRTSLDITLEDSSCTIPAYMLKAGKITVGVYTESEENCATSSCDIGIIESIKEKIYDTSVPNKEIWKDIQDNIKNSMKVSEFTDKLNAYLTEYRPTFDTFPCDETLAKLKDNTIFNTRGFYKIGDGGECTYLYTKSWKANSLVRNGKYLIPLSCGEGELNLLYYGIRTGAEYAESNTEILSGLMARIDFGSMLRFPSGHFYFNDTIDLTTSKKQLSLCGAGATFSVDTNTSGMTWLHFPNLAEDGVGILVGTGTLRDFVVCGNPESYSCSLDRTHTYTAPESIVTEVANVKAYGVKGGVMTTISNVSAVNFYYGMYIDTNNVYITDVNFRSCHYGLSIGNDIKVKGLYGWNIMTLLQIRGALSSVNQIRGDSIGEHLVEIISGSSIYLSDLDADYCMKSVVHIGEDATWTTHKSITINGIRGRACIAKAYDTAVDTEPTAQDITADTLRDYALITVSPKTTVEGMQITCGKAGGANPLDSTSKYLTPNILLAAGADSKVQGLQFILADNSVEMTKEWLMNKINNLSTYTDCVVASISCDKGSLYYKKSYSTVTCTVSTTQEYVESYNIAPKISTYLNRIDVTNNTIANCKIDGVTDDFADLNEIKKYVNSTTQPITLVFPYTGNAMMLSDMIHFTRSNITLEVYCDITFTKSLFEEGENMTVFKFGRISDRTPISNINFIGHGITIDANGAALGVEQASHSQVAEGNGIRFQRILGGTIKGVHVTNALCDGILIYNSKNVIVEDCEVSGTVMDNGLTVMGLPLFSTDWQFDKYADRCRNNVIVRNCVAHNNEDLGFSASVCYGVTFENCFSYENGNADGFNAGGGYSAEGLNMSAYFEVTDMTYDMDITFSNCRALNNNNYAFYTDINGMTVDSCIVDKTIANDTTTSNGRNIRGGNGIFGNGIGRLDVLNTYISNTAMYAVCTNPNSNVTLRLEKLNVTDCAKGVYVPCVAFLYIKDLVCKNTKTPIYLNDGTKKKYVELKNISLYDCEGAYIGGAEYMDADNIYLRTADGVTVAMTLGNVDTGVLQNVKVYKGDNTKWLTGVYINDTTGTAFAVSENMLTDANIAISDKRATT